MKALVNKLNMTFWDSTFWQNYAEIPVAQITPSFVTKRGVPYILILDIIGGIYFRKWHFLQKDCHHYVKDQ